jgi:chitinase
VIETYVDVCPTGLTTITTTYKTTVDKGSSTPAVPSGWTTTVTVYGSPKPTTITLTKPVSPVAVPTSYASTVKEIVTVVVQPVPANEYYSSLSAAGKPVPSGPAAPVQPASSYTPVAPVAVSSGSPAKAVYPSGSSVKPVYAPSGTGYWGSKTSSGPIATFTGAASRINVGVGAVVGLALAVAAM